MSCVQQVNGGLHLKSLVTMAGPDLILVSRTKEAEETLKVCSWIFSSNSMFFSWGPECQDRDFSGHFLFHQVCRPFHLINIQQIGPSMFNAPFYSKAIGCKRILGVAQFCWICFFLNGQPCVSISGKSWHHKVGHSAQCSNDTNNRKARFDLSRFCLQLDKPNLILFKILFLAGQRH